MASHPAVAECAVIGVADDLKGQSPRAFVVLKGGVEIDPDELTRQIVADVREHVGPVAAFKEVVIVPGLPKTRSGKILRRTMRGIADGRPEQVPSTIEDASVLEVLTPLLLKHSGQAGLAPRESWARRALTAPARCWTSTATSASASPDSTAARARACSSDPRATLSAWREPARPVHLGGVPQRRQDPFGPRCGPQDRPVEGAIRRGHGGWVDGVRLLGGDQLRVRGPHGSDVLGAVDSEGATSEVVLDERTQVVDLLELVEVQLGHPVAAVRDVGDVALGLEHPQRLTDRDPADAQGDGEVLLADGDTWRDVPAQDPGAHLDEHRLLGGGRALEISHGVLPGGRSGAPVGSRRGSGTA